MKLHAEAYCGKKPVEKRYSLLEYPDTGEAWPDNFDAVTITQVVPRFLKAKEMRRWLNHFFEEPRERDPGTLYGAILHREGNEHQASVAIDTNNAYHNALFWSMAIVGNPEYGYAPLPQGHESDSHLTHDKCLTVDEGDYITYFAVPHNFEEVKGEVLSMMVACARDKVAHKVSDRLARHALLR